ncbi:MAG: transporter substrate-binding domain-containing protein [Burkholderiaceae bacterium]
MGLAGSLLVLFSLLLLLLPPAWSQPLQLRTVQQNGALAKYGAHDAPAGGLPGLCTEILRAVEQASPGLQFIGLESRVPLRRLERMLGQGEIDVFFCLLKSPERLKQWRYVPVPLYRIRHMVAQRADDTTELRDIQDLVPLSKKKPLLVPQGTILASTLARAGIITAEAPSEREALQMLLLGRTDAVYGQDINLLRNLREAGLEGRLKLAPVVFAEEAQYLALSKLVPPAIEQRLTQVLQALERDGALRVLAEKYR